MDDTYELARRHLWGHFTPLSMYRHATAPLIVRGEGAYVWDDHGRRYLDGLSGLFVVMVGHGRRELAQAAAEQASKLAFFPLWGYAHEPGARLAGRLASLAPAGLDRVFFTTGGGEAVEAAWKLAMSYFRAIGQPDRRKVLVRHLGYHGTGMGALSLTGVADYRVPYEPLVPGAVRVANTGRFRCLDCSHLDACTLRCADDIEQRILMEGPASVAMVLLEPVQNTGGAIVAPPGYWARVRDICDRYGVLLVSDEVICAFGRLGEWFGAQRFDYQPDLITFAKGVTSGYAPLGGVIVSDRVTEPFQSDERTFLHGLTFGGHPVSCAVGLANIELMEREDVLGNVRKLTPVFDQVMDGLRDLPIVGDVRGDGFFRAVELVKDHGTRESFDDEESHWLLRDMVSPRLFEAGLICRADDRADPLVVLAPPLVCGETELETIGATLRTVLTEAWDAFARRRP